MIVFELIHTYYMYKDEIYYSLRVLGFYKSKKDIDEAIALYRTKPGYCDAPDGFAVRRRKIAGNVENDTFFEALVYSYTHDYENYEYTAELGLFASETDAQNALITYRSDNESFFRNTSMEIEEIINKCQINHRYCVEGFTVEVIDQ